MTRLSPPATVFAAVDSAYLAERVGFRSRRRTWMRMGDPTKPNASRSWLIKKRS
jgi:hypothetical protein